MSSIVDGVWWPWLKLFGLVLAMVGLIFLAWWSLFFDRPRGRRRCPRCWYDLTYSPGMTCGECGRTARREAEFNRIRRRNGLAVPAILGAAIIGGVVIDGARARGWATYVPTRVLIWAMPVVNDRNPAVFDELVRRMRGGDFSDGQWLALLRRSAAGDAGMRPPDQVWIDSWYSELANTSGRQLLYRIDDEDARREAGDLLLELAMKGDPVVEITTRESWPAGVAPTLDVRARDWWGRGVAQMRIEATPRLPGAQPRVHVRRQAPIQTRSYSLHLPPLPPGEHEVEIDLAIARRALGGDDWIPAGALTVMVPVHIEEGAARDLEPVTDDALDAVIRRVFRQGLVKYEGGSLPVRVGLNARLTFADEFNDTAVAVRIDVLRNGEAGRRLDIWWKGGRRASDRQYAWEVPTWNDALLGAPLQDGEQWTLRVRGDRNLALRVDGVTRYWAGDVTVPVTVTARSEPAPSRGWIQENPGTDERGATGDDDEDAAPDPE